MDRLVRKARIWASFCVSIRLPWKQISPCSGCSKRFEHRSRVDFPDPLEPIKAMTSPWLAVKSTPLRTSRFPKLLWMFLSSITGLDMAHDLIVCVAERKENMGQGLLPFVLIGALTPAHEANDR